MMSTAIRALALALTVCSCANAGNGGVGGGGGDDAPKTDASVKTDAAGARPDAPSTTDAPVVDAPMVMVDAAVDAASGPFCAQNSECTVAGECCVTIGGPQGFCAPGSVILGQCFPQ